MKGDVAPEVWERLAAHARDVRERIARHNGFDTYEEWQEACRVAKERRARKEMVMANKEMMNLREQLNTVLSRLKATHTNATTARDALRAELAGLATPRAMKHLSEVGRLEARRAALQQARSVRPQIDQALALATETARRRETVTGTRQVLKRARFVDAPPLEADGSRVKPEVHELRLLREELQRARWRADLMDMDAGELAEEIAEAAASQNYALLNLASRVVRVRSKDDAKGLQAAQLALINAEQSIELPDDVQEVAGAFEEIDSLARHLSDVLHEIDTGKEPAAPRASIERVAALAAEHGPDEGAIKFAEERTAARNAVKDQADSRAAATIDRAIGADEADAAAMHNNPAA